MNKYANRWEGNKELGECERRAGLPQRVVGLWPAELPRALPAASTEELSVRVPHEKKLGRRDAEV